MNKSDYICFRWSIPALVTILTIPVMKRETHNWFPHHEAPIPVLLHLDLSASCLYVPTTADCLDT